MEMQISTVCWHCPWAWWEAAATIAIAVVLLALGFYVWRKDTLAWRAAGALLFIVVTLTSYVTTMATVRFGVNITGASGEPRNHPLEIALMLALYVPIWLLVAHHRRLKTASVPAT